MMFNDLRLNLFHSIVSEFKFLIFPVTSTPFNNLKLLFTIVLHLHSQEQNIVFLV